VPSNDSGLIFSNPMKMTMQLADARSGSDVIFGIATISRAWSGKMAKGWSKLDELIRILSWPTLRAFSPRGGKA
jgi:hypothetical protein